jgi:hypothetical protein
VGARLRYDVPFVALALGLHATGSFPVLLTADTLFFHFHGRWRTAHYNDGCDRDVPMALEDSSSI